MTGASPSYPTLADLLRQHAAVRPHATALETVSGTRLTYGALQDQVERTRLALRAQGIRAHDRVAMILPDGIETAAAFLSIAASAVAAPLNPAFRATKLLFYFQDVQARAVRVPAGTSGEVIDVVAALGITLLEMVPRPAGDGTFELRSRGSAMPVPDPEIQPDDVALVLHTSGSTARPKLVPLTHRNLAAAARFTGAALQLGPADRALHVVPMFHVQGLVTTLLAPLAAGGAVICTPGFQPFDFLRWVETTRATWYTAVPTMHQAIVDYARRVRFNPRASALRLVRSSAAPLSIRLCAELEQVFGAPVVNGYGMTEAAPIIASTPLGTSRPGSVGIAAGPELAVLDAGGAPCPAHAVGEIAVRGANVMSGYERNAAANAAAFVDGWFKTGDQGYLDSDGYLYLTGRLKDVINRGGEKIAPREIEETLLEHPAVAQAVVFGVADPLLGQRVAAAVVKRANTDASARELLEYVGRHLAFFKIPSQIVFTDSLPKGPTGKLLRVGLEEVFGLSLGAASADENRVDPPRTETERELEQLWCATLELKRVGIHDNFFALGGNSIAFIEVLYRIRERFGIEMPLHGLVQSPTITTLAAKLDGHRAAAAQQTPAVVTVPPVMSRTERELAAIWKDMLGVAPERLDANFFEMGGEEVPVARLFERIRTVFGRDLPVRALLERPTLRGLAAAIDEGVEDKGLIVPLKTSGTKTAIFAIHDGAGYFFYWRLAHRAAVDRPLYAVLAHSHLNGWQTPYGGARSVESLAAKYVAAIRKVQPHGPYHLAGASFGGTVAYEVARQLRQRGEDVASLVLLCAPIRRETRPHPAGAAPADDSAAPPFAQSRLRAAAGRIVRNGLQRCGVEGGLGNVSTALARDAKWRWAVLRRQPIAPTLIHARFLRASRGLVERYAPRSYDRSVILFRATGDRDTAADWSRVAEGGLRLHDVEGRHMEIMKPPMVDRVADLIAGYVAEAEQRLSEPEPAAPFLAPLAIAG